MKQKLLLTIALLCAVAQGAWAQRVVNLSTISSDYVAHDGDVLTGNLASPYKVIIDDNATVTLSGVSIICNNLTDKIGLSCIKCLGNAEIILAEGTSNGIYPRNCPGIWVGPEGTTTTIKGTGSIKVKVLGGGILALAVMKTVVISSLKMELLRQKQIGIMMRREITMVVQELALHLNLPVVILPLKAAKLQLTAVDLELVLVKEVKYFVKLNAAQLKF